ncbi:O-antigen ligase family protein [Sphingopyxis italica]
MNLSIAKKLSEVRQNVAVWMPVIFLVLVFLMGGGSRSDVSSLPLLRGFSVVIAAWALLKLEPADWRRIRVPMALLVLLTAWMAVQLIPLPPSTWHALPGREFTAQIDALLGQSELWRPLSLTPGQTWNALLGMTVLFAGLLVAARLGADDYPRVMFAIVLLGCASALLGFLQVLGGSGSPAYLYRITNDGAMVGLFSNRNHHAIFLSCVTLVAAMLLRDELMRKRKRAAIRAGLLTAIIFLTICTVLIGSRAGLVATVITFVVSYAIVLTAWLAKGGHPRAEEPRHRFLSGRRLVLALPPVLLALSVAVVLTLSNRVTSVTRLAGEAVADDMRILAWPTIETMIGKFWLLGSGFGSFPDVYRIFEPDALLQPSYFNHAHNDWAELIITGGLPFALLTLAGLFWLVRRIMAQGARNLVKGYRGDLRLPVAIILGVLMMASFVDYPLRVPSLQVFAILMTVLLCCPPAASRTGPE